MFEVSEDRAAAYQKYFLRLMAKFERGMSVRFYPILQQTYEEVGELFKHGHHDFPAAYERHTSRVRIQLEKEYRNLLAYFGTFAFDQFKKAYSKGVRIPEKKGMEDIYWQDVSHWAKFTALKKAADISKTTKGLINLLIRRGMRDGLSNDDIVKEIIEKRKTFNKVRAVRIVRTETHSAVNKATDASVKSTGYKHIRIWRAALDDRVRGADPRDIANHLAANGQKRDLDVAFDIKYGASVDKLMYPGDPTARAAQTVNCRCVLTYTTQRARIE